MKFDLLTSAAHPMYRSSPLSLWHKHTHSFEHINDLFSLFVRPVTTSSLSFSLSVRANMFLFCQQFILKLESADFDLFFCPAGGPRTDLTFSYSRCHPLIYQGWSWIMHTHNIQTCERRCDLHSRLKILSQISIALLYIIYTVHIYIDIYIKTHLDCLVQNPLWWYTEATKLSKYLWT